MYKQIKVLEMKSKATVTRGKAIEAPKPKEPPLIAKPVDVDAETNGQESNSSLHSSHYPGSKSSSQKAAVETLRAKHILNS